MPQDVENDILVRAFRERYERAWSLPRPRQQVDSVWNLALQHIEHNTEPAGRADELEERRADLSQRVRDAAGHFSDAQQQYDNLQERYDLLASELEHALDDSARQSNLLTQYERSAQDFQARLEAAETGLRARRDDDAEIRLDRLKLSKELHDSRATVAKLERKIAEAERLQQEQQTAFQQRLEKEREQYRQQLDDLHLRHADQHAATVKEHRQHIDGLEGELRNRSRTLRDECDASDRRADALQQDLKIVSDESNPVISTLK
ncbi:hypothetical protein OC842_004983, partial [Tilletia horrida]